MAVTVDRLVIAGSTQEAGALYVLLQLPHRQGNKQEGPAGVLSAVCWGQCLSFLHGTGASEGDALKGDAPLCALVLMGSWNMREEWCRVLVQLGELLSAGTTAAAPSGRTGAEFPAAPYGKGLLPPFSFSVLLIGCAGQCSIPLTSKMALTKAVVSDQVGLRMFEKDKSISVKTLPTWKSSWLQSLPLLRAWIPWGPWFAEWAVWSSLHQQHSSELGCQL